MNRAQRTPWLFTLALSAALAAPAFAEEFEPPWQEWRPIDAALLAATTPSVDKDAGAEVVFWNVWVEDDVDLAGDPQAVFRHYVRVKLFDERGREAHSRIDLVYDDSHLIQDIAARTVTSDGTIVELKKADIFERTIAKGDGIKLKARSFAMPGAAIGAVIEYRWKETRLQQLSNYVRLELQREIPVQQVSYLLKPLRLPGFDFSMRLQAYHADLNRAQIASVVGGYRRIRFDRLPASKDEPRSPPRSQTRAWLLVYYAPLKNVTEEKFWKDQSKELFGGTKGLLKGDDSVVATAAELVKGESEAARKLERIYEHCRTRIKRVDDDASGLSVAERAKLKRSKSPSETLRRGAGTGRDVNLLFGALAAAAGFEARIAKLSDRSDMFFDRHFLDDHFLSDWVVAIKLDEWRFFDPASTYMPAGMLHWTNEGVPALIAAPTGADFVQTPFSAAEKSGARRQATLRLSEDGTLEGEVRVEYFGHTAAELKERADEDSAEAREKALRERVQARLSGAELTDVTIENVTAPDLPMVETYKLRVPGYAQRTGKRLFLQPAFFERGRSALFSEHQRVHPVYFNYPWSEQDEVSIALPRGFELESPDAPVPVAAGLVADHRVRLTVKQAEHGKQLGYVRKFMFGGGDRILFPVDHYPILKEYFDAVHAADGHTLTLKQVAP